MAMKRWNGSSYTDLTTRKRWNGSSWVDLTVARRWNGTRWVTMIPISFVAAGTGSAANNGNVTPGIPAGMQVGDVMFLHASIRVNGGTVNTPSGWNALENYGHVSSALTHAIFWRAWQSGDAAPTVTFTGGSAGSTTLGMIYGFRGLPTASITEEVVTNQSNAASSTNLDFPSVTTSTDGCLVMAFGHRLDDSTGAPEITAPANWTLGGTIDSTLGTDALQSMVFRVLSPAGASGVNAMTVNATTTSVISISTVMAIAP